MRQIIINHSFFLWLMLLFVHAFLWHNISYQYKRKELAVPITLALIMLYIAIYNANSNFNIKYFHSFFLFFNICLYLYLVKVDRSWSFYSSKYDKDETPKEKFVTYLTTCIVIICVLLIYITHLKYLGRSLWH